MVEHLVLTGELTDERAIVVLKSHGFIVKTEGVGWRLRVPLFESWVREFRFYG